MKNSIYHNFTEIWVKLRRPGTGRISGHERSGQKREKRLRGPPEPSKMRQKTGPNALFEGGLDAGEGRVQLRAEALDDGDDCNRDAGGDEAVFDGGRARLVLHKALHESRHE